MIVHGSFRREMWACFSSMAVRPRLGTFATVGFTEKAHIDLEMMR